MPQPTKQTQSASQPRLNPKLVRHIETVVMPRYQKNDISHQRWHIDGVIKRSLDLAATRRVKPDLVYTIAAYHDLGCQINREEHEHESAKLCRADQKLTSFFTTAELDLAADAIEDHRASNQRGCRSIYGKIIATADKFTSIPDLMRSVGWYQFEHFPDAPFEQYLEGCIKYVAAKYGPGGYIAVPLPHPPFDHFLAELRTLINDRAAFATYLRAAHSEYLDLTAPPIAKS